MVEYQVLAMLSESPDRTMRMSSLAEVTNASLSRLSRLVQRLEDREFVRREPDPDGRTVHESRPHGERLPGAGRSGAGPRRACALTRGRRALVRAAAAPGPRRGPHYDPH